MRLFLLTAVLALFALPAYAAPDCSNVSSDSRLAGCNGLPDFNVLPEADDDRGDPTYADRFRESVEDKQ